MFSRPKILFLVSLLFVALLNLIPTYLLNFLIFIILVYRTSNDSSTEIVGTYKLIIIFHFHMYYVATYVCIIRLNYINDHIEM